MRIFLFKRKKKRECQGTLSPDVVFERMEAVVCAKKLYLDNNLMLSKVAGETGTNRTYISRALKSRGLTFNTYINSFRIQHAIELMGRDGNGSMRIGEIAYLSGFASERAMNYYLTKTVGVTAGVFRKRAQMGVIAPRRE